MFSQMPKARIKKLPKINIFEDVSREHIPTDINNFDKSQLKKMETVEKVVLPKTEGITHSTYFSTRDSEIAREKISSEIESFKPETLNHVEIQEKELPAEVSLITLKYDNQS